MVDSVESEKWECHHCQKMVNMEDMIEIEGYFFCSKDCSALYDPCCGGGGCGTS
jgi:endogenous inhibitor of DNA gyrase (YacG/DUF329 family)